jgi:hypothetical protein
MPVLKGKAPTTAGVGKRVSLAFDSPWEKDMSPTQFAAAKARIEKDVERARKAGDIVGLQAAAAEQTALFSSYYGYPSETAA